MFAVWSFRGKGGLSLQNKPKLALRLGGCVLMILSASMFFELAFGKISFDGETLRSGGILGGALSGWVSGTLGPAGATFLGALLTILALMAAVDFSPVSAYRISLDLFASLRERLGSSVVKWREAEKRHKEVAEVREEIEKSRTQPKSQIKIVIDEKPKTKSKPQKSPKQEKFSFAKDENYEMPSIELLDEVGERTKNIDQEALLMNAQILESKFRDFGIKGEVVQVQPGPVVTMYEFKPGPGIKINKIAGMSDDLAMALSAVSVRIIAPIPGKDVVGIEISNRDREMVYLREIIGSDEFNGMKSKIPIGLGKNITGDPSIFDLRRAPHLLVAGSTGAGKSVSLNTMIMSILFRSTPNEVKMVMVDPKRLELSIYEGVPHLIHKVISDPKDASLALKWTVAEMERRYQLLSEHGVRSINSYNKLVKKAEKENAKNEKKTKKASVETDDSLSTVAIKDPETTNAEETKPPLEHLPVIVVIIDELADLMMVAAKDIEESICRLAQMARAAGIHMILATQRPSVDVITGLIKANFPSRIAFKVSSKIDSRTIMDQNGAESLLGMGDMLLLAPGTSDLMRLHGAFVSDEEIKRVVAHWVEQGTPDYIDDIIKPQADEKAEIEDDLDARWDEAVRIVVDNGQASVSMLQRKMKIGYNRSARIIERMEIEGIVGPSDGVSRREVLIDAINLEEMTGS
jgi:DNA segregation ATPase FtsK/SpoIIIE, S-DNA-T family